MPESHYTCPILYERNAYCHFFTADHDCLSNYIKIFWKMCSVHANYSTGKPSDVLFMYILSNM